MEISDIAANEKGKSLSIGSDSVLRRRKASNEEGSLDKKPNGKKPMEVDEETLNGNKPMAKKGNLTIDAVAKKSTNAGKRKVMAEEENADKVKSVQWTLRPGNARKGDGIIEEKAKQKKPETRKSGSTHAEIGRVESAAKRKTVSEEESASADRKWETLRMRIHDIWK